MTVRFTYSVGMPDPSYYLDLARAVEQSGWDTLSVADSVCYPRDSSSKYPYTDDGSRRFLANKPFIEPLSLISAMAAVTNRLQFLVAVLKAPIRHPVLLAKQATSVATLSQSRLKLGVGTSPFPDDYEVCGVPWEGRGHRLDEVIAVVRGLSTGDYFEFQGSDYQFPAVRLNPVPATTLPILVGGHSETALRRAAANDGWVSAGSDEEMLRKSIASLKVFRELAGLDWTSFEIHVRSPHAATADGVRRLDELGVTDIGMRFEDTYRVEPDDAPLQSRLDDIRRYAEDVISAVHR
jgi:probable F420-dependent oxidoreductase